MGLNYQDVIRDVHDPSQHALKTTASLSASTVYVGNPTLYAVVNTGAAGDSTANIGFATVAISNPTLYAVVNTGAAGVGNSIVTVANPNFGINAGVNGIGFSTVNVAAIAAGANYIGLSSVNIGGTLPALSSGVGNIGFATVAVSTPTLFAVVNTAAAGQASIVIDTGTKQIGSVTVSHPISIAGNITLSDPKTYIGLTTATIGSMPSVLSSGQYFPAPQSVASGALSPLSVDATGKLLLGDPKTYIGLASVSGVVGLQSSTLNIGSVSILGGVINANLNAGIAGIGFATVFLAAGNSNVGDVDVASIAAGANYVGLASVNIGGTLPALSAGVAGIGFVTAAISTPTLFAVVNTGAVGVTNSIVTVANPNFGINAGVNSIGFASVTPVAAWPDPKTYIGLVTIDIGASKTVTLGTGTLNIGSVSVLGGTINSTLQTSTLNIGSVSILGGGIGLNAGVNGIGFATVKIDAGTQFIGLVTANTRNAGTNKTLVNLPLAFSTSSVVTVATVTNANTLYITNLLLNSNATVRIALKSGVTYLTGNASIGVTLNPGGGMVMTGSPDSPSWIGLPSGALVIEKFDLTGTSAQIGGNVVYYQE